MNFNGNHKISIKIEKEVDHCAMAENPMRDDAFSLDDEMKIALIKEKFEDILSIIGLHLNDDSIADTPHRIAKMYINEIFSGLNPKNRPEITLFENKYNYHSPLIEMNIPFTSFCEHHFVPIIGNANIAYIPNNYVIGLSKLHRITDYYAKRPQVQERLTQQIHKDLTETMQTSNVGIVLKASHTCISCRGVADHGSSTITSVFSGKIADDSTIISLLRGN